MFEARDSKSIMFTSCLLPNTQKKTLCLLYVRSPGRKTHYFYFMFEANDATSITLTVCLTLGTNNALGLPCVCARGLQNHYVHYMFASGDLNKYVYCAVAFNNADSIAFIILLHPVIPRALHLLYVCAHANKQ